MKNSRLFEVLSHLSVSDRKKLRKFVASPYFNQRSDLVALLEMLLKYLSAKPVKVPTKAEIFHQLLPNEALDLTKLRLLMSYLLKLIEQYLVFNQLEENQNVRNQALIKALRTRNLNKEANRFLQKSFQQLDQQNTRNEAYWMARYHLNWERYQLESTQQPLTALNLHAVSEASAIAHCATQLRLAYLSLAHQRVYQQADISTDIAEDLISRIQKSDWLEKPLIRLYYHGYQMLKFPKEEKYFLEFKKVLIESGQQFPLEEIRDLYLGGINFCIRQVNSGDWDEKYFVEGLDLYKEGLRSAYLLQNGQLSRFTYYNIVVAALKVKEYEWAESFIDQYQHAIEKGYQKSYYSFNKARLAYARKNYDAALLQLQNFNYRDTLLNLAARVISIKIYYETKEWPILESQLEAMKNYLRRKSLIGYHRQLFRSFIKYTQGLVTVNRFDQDAVEKLKAQIEREEQLTEKDWLLRQLGEG